VTDACDRKRARDIRMGGEDGKSTFQRRTFSREHHQFGQKVRVDVVRASEIDEHRTACIECGGEGRAHLRIL